MPEITALQPITPPEPTLRQRADLLIAQLQDVTEHLAATRTQEKILEIVLHPALEALGGQAGTVLLVQDDGLHVVAQHGQDEATRSIWQDSALSDETPATDVLRTQEPLFFEHGGSLIAAYPELEARTDGKAAVASAVLPLFLEGQPLGVIVLDFKEPYEFTPVETRFLRTLAAQCAVALGRARLQQDLEARVAARTAELEEERAALDAFVAYKEAVGGVSDVLALARQAVRVVHASLEHVSAAYYELEDGLWKAQVWSEDIPAEIVAEIQHGVPQDAPHYAEAARTQAAVFADGWDASANGVQHAEAYGAAAFLPLVVHGETRSLFSVGMREARAWTEREKALVRAVVRGLDLTLERTEITRRLQAQNAELDARTRALEAFAELTRDLTLHDDPYILVQRAQQVVLSLLPDGYALYFEPEGERWVLRAQTRATAKSASGLETPSICELWGRGVNFSVPQIGRKILGSPYPPWQVETEK